MVSTRTKRRRRQRKRSQSGMAPPPSVTGSYSELTVPGNYAWGGIDYRELINVKPVTHDEIQMMLDLDGHARALFNAYRRPIQRNAQRAFVKPVRKGEGQAEADFIHSNLLGPRPLGGTTIPFVKTISHMCTAFAFGFKAFEKKHDRPGTVVDDGFIRLRKLAPRDSRTVSFLTDDKGGFNGIKVRASWKGQMIDRSLNKNRSVFFSVDEEESPLYGKSLFLPTYYHFDKKHKMYYITHLALAVGALAPRLAKAPTSANEADKRTFLEALSNLGTNAAMLLPDGYEMLENISVSTASGLPFMEMIRHHDLMMSQSFLAQALDIGTGESGGGFSMNKTHFNELYEGLESHMMDMANLYNLHVIPELIDWNFGTKNFPQIVLPPLTNEIKDATKELFSKMVTARQNNLSPEFAAEIEREMADYLGFEVSEEAIDANQARIVAQEELEKAMEEANAAIGQDASKMKANELLSNPKFLAWAESFSERVRNRQLLAGVFDRKEDDDDDEDVA